MTEATCDGGCVIDFKIGDDPAENPLNTSPLVVRVHMEEGDFGYGGSGQDIRVTLTVESGYLADLYAFFFDVKDDSVLGHLQFWQNDALITASEQDGDVSDLGNGANVTPLHFEAGLRFGGPGQDGLTEITFAISSDLGDLCLEDLLAGELAGIRAQAVGTTEANANGSSKLVTQVPACTEQETCFEGLSHGYWKTHGLSLDSASFEQFFDVDISWSQPGNGKKNPIAAADVSFEQALNLTGGGINALAREAVAAVQNASSDDINYFQTIDQIKALVKAAFNDYLANSNPEHDLVTETKDLLEANNTLGLCSERGDIFMGA